MRVSATRSGLYHQRNHVGEVRRPIVAKKAPSSAPARARTGIAQRRAERRAAGWRRSDQRWSEIVEGAARVFSRLGYAQTSLEDVAQEVGINRATLYYYVGTKAELLASVLNRPVVQITEDIREIRDMDLPPRAKLELAVARHMQNLADNYPQLFIFLAENLHVVGDTADPDIASAAQEYGEIFTGIIREGMRSGAFRDDIDAHIAMLGIVGMCNWTHRWYQPRGQFTLPLIGEQFSRMVIDGLCLSPSPRRGAGAERARVAAATTRRPNAHAPAAAKAVAKKAPARRTPAKTAGPRR
jgi:TetR/AcrR family transcriptional regulator, cholesterol catabolism regulator